MHTVQCLAEKLQEMNSRLHEMEKLIMYLISTSDRPTLSAARSSNTRLQLSACAPPSPPTLFDEPHPHRRSLTTFLHSGTL